MTTIRPRFLLRAALWLLIYVFLLSYLEPGLLLSDTITTGGDTGSHYPTAVWLRDHLLSQGRIVSWHPGNYAGFPLFQLYFPLPFLLMVLLDLVFPLTVAFKLVSVSGLLTLPPAAAFFLRRLGFKDPAPDLGAAFILVFLFMEANSAWGGNITSTLAGEFTYSLGLSLSLVYLGRLYSHAEDGRGVFLSAALLAAIGLCHGYTLLFCVTGAGFLLLTPENWTRRLAHVLEVNLLAFGLMGFWIVPLLFYLPYSTPFNFVWIIDDWQTVLPPGLWPPAAAAVLGLAYFLFRPVEGALRRAASFLVYLGLVSVVFYFIAFKIGLVDVRFLPTAQVALVLLGAASAGRLLSGLRAKELAALGLSLAAAVWAANFENNISAWVRWNYSGWGEKALWPAFSRVAGHLKGDFSDPRVVYEHSSRLNAAGTIRAFESLPFFAGRATLEGVYIQASLSTPAVFYLQSLVSQEISAPLSLQNYGRFDLARARERLELFNVSHYVTATPESFEAARSAEGFELEKSAPPLAVFRLTGASGRYVVEPGFQPVLALSADPERDGFAWFRRGDLEVPLVLARRVEEKDRALFAAVIGPAGLPEAVDHLPRRPLTPAGGLKETVRDGEIAIEGAEPRKPLWIRISYHPRWQVEGADKVWRTAPAFMLVFPRERTVRLYFGRGFPDHLGLVLTGLAFLYAVLMFTAWRGRSSWVRPPGAILLRGLEPVAARLRPRAGPVLALAVAALAALVLYLVLAVSYQDPTVQFTRGRRLYDQKDYDGARRVFAQTMAEFPLFREVDQTLHHLALCYYHQGRFAEARRAWRRFEEYLPESRILPEVLYHVALSYQLENRLEEAREAFAQAVTRFPDSPWADWSEKGLLETIRLLWENDFAHARILFDQGRYT
ncbi:MAG: 6-pyruvoyl-tetrahydropterin synthase-related protein, partial [Thermodesulfobacteriota bacterium]